ncbi:MAG: hypothetical protein JWR86_2759, partial [Enterovirga sp.]|nr:hypothetical protein [Enterovirga sp.]
RGAGPVAIAHVADLVARIAGGGSRRPASPRRAG